MTPAQRRLCLLLVTGEQNTGDLALALYGGRHEAGRAEMVAGKCVTLGYLEQGGWDGSRWTYRLTDKGREALAA